MYRNHWRVCRPFHLYRHWQRELLFAILKARIRDSRVAAPFVHADDSVFVLLLRREFAFLDATPAPAHRGFGKRRLDLRFQFLLCKFWRGFSDRGLRIGGL